MTDPFLGHQAEMTDADERRFMAAFTRELEADRGEEAQRHLDAGRPIYYADDRHRDALVKEFPDGRRQLVTFEDDTETVLRDL